MFFFGFMRLGEVVAPSESSFNSSVHLAHGEQPPGPAVYRGAGEGIEYRQGVKVYLGKAPGKLCPVAAVLGYMAIRGTQLGLSFIWSNGKFLTRERFV